MSKKTTKKVQTTAQGNIDTGATESEAYVSIRRDASDVNPNVRPKSMLITKIAAVLVWLGVFVGIAACVFALLMSKDMLKDKPELDIAKLQSPDSTTIYDSEGNIIIELGLYLRENIEYDEMPTSLIDAFLAIEDSRFYSHFGFDIPRFTQAAITNIKSGDFSQGGSTITMQLIKNSYFQVDAGSDSTIADREGSSGIKRKLQEIVLAIELNQCESKEEVFALFLNKVNFGNKIRGVEKASQYYFGKSARDLSLPESAFLAGIINSPNNFNPYNDLSKNLGVNQYLDPDMEYLENAQTRKNQVLDLMVLHGYITEEEAALAKTVRMEDLLSGLSEKWSEKSEYYQSYIDAVIEEATKKTGLDPYTTSMKIYSNMDQHMQRFVYDIQNGNTDIYFRKPESQNAIVLMNNQNGALIALGGGRDQTEARMFNRATSAYIQPGSTIKPVLEYALAFEWLGWATSYTITDRPIYLYNGHNLVVNANGQP
ncbi:MAG: transglycosylase domain-containing protein, partial [Erysipelotrichaceae bacterium]|nr:transglycosylase domain-containing protein [Erysipelotrichaceae bacterium]